MKLPIRVLLTAAVASATLVACATKTKPVPPAAETTTRTNTETTPPNAGGRYKIGDLDTDSCLRQRVVYFDFDRTDIKSQFQAAIGCHAQYLRQNPNTRVTLEGSADERGTREYNLGLGERRGNSVSAAIQGNGGSAGQISVVSYGEERPTCADSS